MAAATTKVVGAGVDFSRAVDTAALLKFAKTKGTLVDVFKGMDASAFRGIPADDMTDILKGLDDAQLAKIGKKLDVGYVKGLDPQLAAKLKPGFVNKLRLKGTKKLDDLYPPNSPARRAYDDGVKKQTELNKLATGKPTSVSNVDELGTVTGVPVEKLNKQATMWQKVVNGDTLIQQGLKKLGYTNIAIGGFVIMVLCMMYDTDNPFKALDRALGDAGTSIRAIKEVAEEAAEAAVDVTKGGFNFVSFVTKNSGLSSACSILCLILIVAMVMLSFMSGGKNK
tara:strand:+ start:50 stop:895 length:846 start_codon:yes stop_codon:yes gene_type:complete